MSVDGVDHHVEQLLGFGLELFLCHSYHLFSFILCQLYVTTLFCQFNKGAANIFCFAAPPPYSALHALTMSSMFTQVPSSKTIMRACASIAATRPLTVTILSLIGDKIRKRRLRSFRNVRPYIAQTPVDHKSFAVVEQRLPLRAARGLGNGIAKARQRRKGCELGRPVVIRHMRPFGRAVMRQVDYALIGAFVMPHPGILPAAFVIRCAIGGVFF